MDEVASAIKDHRARIKSIQRQRHIVYEQVMSRAPCTYRTLDNTLHLLPTVHLDQAVD